MCGFPLTVPANVVNPLPLRNRIRSTQGPSIEEVEGVLDQVWIRRIWTFQEAVLANNPVIICGRQNLACNRLALSVVYLRAFEKYPSLQAWLDLVYSRAHFQTKRNAKELTPTKLQEYKRFCDSVMYFCNCLRVFPSISSVLWIIGATLVPLALPRKRGQDRLISRPQIS